MTFTALRDFNPIRDYDNVTHNYRISDTTVYITPLTLVIGTGTTQPGRAYAYREAGTRPVSLKIRSRKILADVVPGSAPVRVVWE